MPALEPGAARQGDPHPLGGLGPLPGRVLLRRGERRAAGGAEPRPGRALRAPHRQAGGLQPPASRERPEVPPLRRRAGRALGPEAGAREAARAPRQGREERRAGEGALWHPRRRELPPAALPGQPRQRPHRRRPGRRRGGGGASGTRGLLDAARHRPVHHRGHGRQPRAPGPRLRRGPRGDRLPDVRHGGHAPHHGRPEAGEAGSVEAEV
mmetsp:Transcript_63373/g.196325  ORF Transcript_63373/g.196325 Transcript_63373/m.196325 type:complete len:210 (+) Transcript_63373:724-1353(+)